jgi:hypothetical protein
MQSTTLTRRRPGPIWLAHIRSTSGSTWVWIALAVLCVGALAGYIAFPTYPTYDSFYALLWGRDLLHLQAPDFQIYRAPTEHPLAIAYGMLCSLFGQGGARLVVLGSIASFVALVAGVYRLASLCFTPVVGLLAAIVMLSRFFDENLAAQGYLDLSYVALIIWATAFEVARPRRGPLVFLLLAAAGLLRPDAWVLSGLYWLWCAWPAGVSTRRRLAYLALAASAPLIWMGVDAAVTGNPLYSLHATSELAQELGRTKGLGGTLSSLASYSVRIDKLPVVAGALAGVVLALWLVPRRALIPLVVLIAQLFVFLAEGAVGVSVIDRYMLGAAAVMVVFCAVALGGWSMLAPGLARRVWAGAATLLIVYGIATAATTFSLSSLRTTLAYHEDFHLGLAAALHYPKVEQELKRCPLLSLPDNKLIPNARWILGVPNQHDIVARSEARADAERGDDALERRLERGSVAVYPLGGAVFFEAIVDLGDDPRVQVPPAGFRRIYTSRYYAVYANC